jgi:ketosteroid isomerase-like protein
MSEENVEVVRRAWEAYHRRDNEAALALYDPTIEIDPSEQTGIDAGVYRGLEGVQDFFRNWLSSFGDLRTEVEEWIGAGDQVIAMVRTYGRGKRSGVPVDTVQAHLWTVLNGKLKRLQIFATKAEALEAVGLRD